MPVNPNTPAHPLSRLGLSRRQLLATGTGVVAASAVVGGAGSPAAPAAASDRRGIVPRRRRGIILYTVRDAVARDPLAYQGPSGFKEVLAELATYGYRQIEFAGYRQHPNAEGGAELGNTAGAALLRQWLDGNGLAAVGNHGFIPPTYPLVPAEVDEFKLNLEIANIIGMPYMGTGADPVGGTGGNPSKAAWDVALAKWNELGLIAAEYGVMLYTHNHAGAYNFLLDSGPADEAGLLTRSSGIRQLEYFIAQSDPRYVYLEMDVYWAHVAQYQFTTFTAADGSTQTDIFEPERLVRDYSTNRFPLFHAKDGNADADLPTGYQIVPFGLGDIDYRRFFQRIGDMSRRNPMVEQDNAPAPNNASGVSTGPGQSLLYAEVGYQNLADLG